MRRGIIWSAVSSERQVDEISLDEQERTAREFAAANGIQVVAAIRWEGYSRYDTDIELALDDFARRGHHGYHQLRDMWRQRSFDVLICYHDSRLGRRTLYNWVVDNVIASGAQIYRIHGGWITARDATVQTALGIIATRSETERFVELTRRAKDKNAADGTLIHSKVPFSHIAVRDDNHRIASIAVNEAHRWIIEEAARLVVAGVAFNTLGDILARRGMLNPLTGQVFRNSFFYSLFYNPFFWGTQARRWKLKAGMFGVWAFDPNAEAPEGALVYYNRHPPALTGDLAEALKAELRRRARSARGNYRASAPSRFSGLLVCADCGYLLSYVKRTGKPNVSNYYRCQTRYMSRFISVSRPAACPAKSPYIREDVVAAWIDAALRRLLEARDLSALMESEPDSDARQLAAAEARIEQIEAEIRTLIGKQANAPSALAAFYEERLTALATELDALSTERRGLHTKLAAIDSGQRRALDTISKHPVEEFWRLPDKEINQILDMLFGDKRIAVREGVIVGVIKM